MKTTPLPAWALAPAVSFLRRNQHDDGGWTYTAALTPAAQSEPSEEDITGATIAALCETGVPAYDPAVSAAARLPARAAGQRQLAGSNTSGARRIPTPTPRSSAGSLPAASIRSRRNGPRGARRRSTSCSRSRYRPGQAGGFGYEDTSAASLYSTQDALRAIAGGVFTAEPQSLRDRRRWPPVLRPPPPGHRAGPGEREDVQGDAPVGAMLSSVLEAAQADSHPSGCVTSIAVADGRGHLDQRRLP